MENILLELYQNLQKQIGLHRQLMDTVRIEREALILAVLKGVEESTYKKEILINSIYQAESERLKKIGELSVVIKKPAKELVLTRIIKEIEGLFPEKAKQFQSVLNTLSVLVQRVTEQNKENKTLVDNFLKHLNQMKKNVLGEAQPFMDTYGPEGKKVNASSGSRLITKEA